MNSIFFQGSVLSTGISAGLCLLVFYGVYKLVDDEDLSRYIL